MCDKSAQFALAWDVANTEIMNEPTQKVANWESLHYKSLIFQLTAFGQDLKLNIWNGRLFTQTSLTNAGILFSFPVETILIILKPNKIHDALIPFWKSQITIQNQVSVFSIYPLNKHYQLWIIIIVSPIGMIWEDTLSDSNNWS